VDVIRSLLESHTILSLFFCSFVLSFFRSFVLSFFRSFVLSFFSAKASLGRKRAGRRAMVPEIDNLYATTGAKGSSAINTSNQ
jgi:hypothetical protein